MKPGHFELNRAQALEIAALRRQGMTLSAIGAVLGGISPQLVWKRSTKGCPWFWGTIPVTRGARVGLVVPRLPPPGVVVKWWRPDAVTRALVAEIRLEMERDAGRVRFNPPER